MGRRAARSNRDRQLDDGLSWCAASELELADLAAECLPLELRVAVEGAALLRRVCAPLEDVVVGAVVLSERDEGPPQVVAAAVSESESRQVGLAQALARVVFVAHPDAAVIASPAPGVLGRQRHDQVGRPRGASHHLLPTRELPLREHRREHRMNRHLADSFGLRLLPIVGALDDERAQRLARFDMAPLKAGRLSVPSRTDSLKRVQDPAVPWNPRVGDELLELVTRVDGCSTPRRVFVLVVAEVALGEHARALIDKALHHCVSKQSAENRVDVAHGSRRLLREPKALDDPVNVARVDVGESHLSDDRSDVVTEARLVVLPVDDLELLPLLDPLVEEPLNRDRTCFATLELRLGA